MRELRVKVDLLMSFSNSVGDTGAHEALLDDGAIVSEQPGTTRDAVDLYFEKDGRTLLLTDTAGLKKEASVSGSVDFYAQRRSERAVERAEGCLLMLDVSGCSRVPLPPARRIPLRVILERPRNQQHDFYPTGRAKPTDGYQARRPSSRDEREPDQPGC